MLKIPKKPCYLFVWFALLLTIMGGLFLYSKWKDIEIFSNLMEFINALPAASWSIFGATVGAIVGAWLTNKYSTKIFKAENKKNVLCKKTNLLHAFVVIIADIIFFKKVYESLIGVRLKIQQRSEQTNSELEEIRHYIIEVQNRINHLTDSFSFLVRENRSLLVE